MDAHTSRNRGRAAVVAAAGLAALVLTAFIASRSSGVPDVGPASDPTSDAGNSTDATLRASAGKPPPPEPADRVVRSEVADQVHARFLKEHPVATGRTAVAGNVVDADGRPVLSGWVIYRSPSGPWQITRIEYDGTFDVVDAGPGPYELIASRGNGPIDRHATVTTAGAGNVGVLLRAPHDAVLRVRLDPPMAGKGYAFLTREDGGDGLRDSSLAHVEDDGRVDFSGLQPGVKHVLWISDEHQDTYAYLPGVVAGPAERVVSPTETFVLRTLLRSTEVVNLDSARVSGLGISIDFRDEAFVRSADTPLTALPIDATLPNGTYGLRLRRLIVPTIPLRFEARGFDDWKADSRRRFTSKASIRPGESIVADWQESR